MIPLIVYVLLDWQASIDVHVHFVRLTAPMTWVNDRWLEKGIILISNLNNDKRPVSIFMLIDDACFSVALSVLHDASEIQKTSIVLTLALLESSADNSLLCQSILSVLLQVYCPQCSITIKVSLVVMRTTYLKIKVVKA